MSQPPCTEEQLNTLLAEMGHKPLPPAPPSTTPQLPPTTPTNPPPASTTSTTSTDPRPSSTNLPGTWEDLALALRACPAEELPATVESATAPEPEPDSIRNPKSAASEGGAIRNTPLGTPRARSWDDAWLAAVDAAEARLGRRICGARFEVLPATLSPDDAGYRLVYVRDNGMAAWVWPEHAPLPPRLSERGAGIGAENGATAGLGFGVTQQFRPALSPPAQLPHATYADVRGQDAAVETVRDLIELPMKHAALFEAVGVSAKPSGVILAGPPGTGKTLLARAIAGECGAHLEIVSGPELLNPYVGATEQVLRDVFDRAKQNAPSLILFDELD